MDLETQLYNYLDTLINIKLNLLEYAVKNNINPIVNGKLNKGWKGLAVEHLLNIKKNSDKNPDLPFCEIKTVPVIWKNNNWQPKETVCLATTEINNQVITDFQSSHLYNKIKSTLFILINVEDPKNPTIVQYKPLKITTHPDLFNIIEQDYNEISSYILESLVEFDNISAISGKIGQAIQIRPKTGSKGDYSWAFYLKKEPLINILQAQKTKTNKIKPS